jgi:acetoin utilization deacetylase AcuC-like enzyme
MTRFHSPEYIQFLKRIAPSNAERFENYFSKFNIGEDWFIFGWIIAIQV